MRMLELSHVVEHGMVTYPGLPAPAIGSCLSFEESRRDGAADHPFLTGAAAEMLVTAGAALVGIDSVKIDDTRGGSRPDAHGGLC